MILDPLMSYALGVFQSAVPLDATAATGAVLQLCVGTDDGSVGTSLVVSRALEVFHRALVARYTEVDHDEDSAFACSIEHTDRWVMMIPEAPLTSVEIRDVDSGRSIRNASAVSTRFSAIALRGVATFADSDGKCSSPSGGCDGCGPPPRGCWLPGGG